MSQPVARLQISAAWKLPHVADRAAGLIGWAVALAHVALLASLLLVLLLARPGNAAETDDLACGAHDLVAELKIKDPAAYEKLIAEGAKIKNSDARFWKLEKPGQPTNWLLGTMHLSDPRVTDLPSEAKSAYDSADTVVLESDEILDQKTASAKLMAQPDMMFFSGTASINDYLKPEEKKILEEGLIKRGIPLAAVAKFKPWMLTPMVALSSCEMARKSKGAPFLDMKLAKDGVAAGKKVKGVETLAEQLKAMSELPIEFHIRSLIATVTYPQYSADMMETTLGLYLEGKIGVIFPAGAYFAPVKDASDFADNAAFEEKIITTRNHHMADRAAPILADGNVFMAVGALHLIGDEGLVELFRKQGYTVTAVR
jgi:uncharacterized protein YbaP (TraB family)